MKRRNFLKYLGIAPFAPGIVCEILVEKAKVSGSYGAVEFNYLTDTNNWYLVDPGFQQILTSSFSYSPPPLFPETLKPARVDSP